MQTIEDLWNGNIAPIEHCGANDRLANELVGLIEKNRQNMRKELTDAQKETFQKYIDCSEEYLLRMLELSFCEGFRLGGKLVMETLL